MLKPESYVCPSKPLITNLGNTDLYVYSLTENAYKTVKPLQDKKTPVTTYLDGEDLTALANIHLETGASLSFLIRKAVKQFLNKEAK